MSDKPENPQAFPVGAGTATDAEIYEGMSLRDYFAGQALNQATREIWSEHKPEDVAGRCYLLADAMLAERQKSS